MTRSPAELFVATEALRTLSEALEMPWPEHAFGAGTSAPPRIEGTFFGAPTRVTLLPSARPNEWMTELRVALASPLPGDLRFLPRPPGDSRTAPIAKLAVQPRGKSALGPNVWVMAERPDAARALLGDAKVVESLRLFFHAHPMARILSGEVVLDGPTPLETEAIRDTLRRAVELARVLDAACSHPTAIVKSKPEDADLLGTISGALWVDENQVVMPNALGPADEGELRLRARFRKKSVIQVALVSLMVPGSLLLLLAAAGNLSSAAVPPGVVLSIVGFVSLFAPRKCPDCGAPVRAISTECRRCGLRLR